MTPIEFYSQSNITLESEKLRIDKKLPIFRIVRLTIFLVSSVFCYFFFGNLLAFSLTIILSIVLFLIVISKYTNLKLKHEIVCQKIKLIDNEKKSLSGDFTGFHAGEKYIDPTHPFSNDLDIFKTNGIFSFLNRTTSELGEKQLKDRLLFGSDSPEVVVEIIRKIAEHMEWTFQFRAVGSLNSREKAKDKLLTSFQWELITSKKWFAILKVIIPIVSFSSLCLYNLDFISGGMFSFLIVLCLFPASLELRNTNAIMNQISELEDRSKILKEQVFSIQKYFGSNEAHLAWIDSIVGFNSSQMLIQINELQKLINRLNTRNNMLLGLVLNVFLAWDIQLRIAFFTWKNKNSHEIEQWEKGLADLEGFVSAATVRYNYPETIFASFDSNKEVNMKGLIHPLLANKKNVSNNFELHNDQQYMILTGPNMAGKSTYLRAVGCAIVFANAGFPVFAEVFTGSKLKLFTSMRTTDDLNESSSYFFAELNRLRMIMDAVESNGNVFVLLDEILKGTNSKDKEEGSYLFMEKMKRLGAKGIIATHDLSLCELENKQTGFYTAHFDSKIENDNLYFDYTLKKGVCQNMNASYLLRKMNLTH
jgi:hypothetical protein